MYEHEYDEHGPGYVPKRPEDCPKCGRSDCSHDQDKIREELGLHPGFPHYSGEDREDVDDPN